MSNNKVSVNLDEVKSSLSETRKGLQILLLRSLNRERKLEIEVLSLKNEIEDLQEIIRGKEESLRRVSCL